MNIKNIAIVRATNTIPFDGIVHPISKIPYLKKEKGTIFAYAMNDLLKKLSKINVEGYWTKTEEEREEMDKQNKEVLEQYLPYNSGYNSMVLWALNGLVPDDMNNTFSNKTCAIIESLEEQINHSEIVSLVPTDTAIKGNVKLSNKAIILVSKERYDSLTEQEKEQLESLDLTIQVFEGTLQDAVNETLKKSELYTAEKLSLARADKGYFESDTKEELIETIQSIAESHNIAQVLHWNVLTGQNDELEKLASVKDEYKNNITVLECYQKTFFKYLFSRLDIDKNVSSEVLGYMESPVYIEALCNEIERIGIDEYKRIVDKYNSSLERLRQNGKLPTPEQIVDLTRENKDFNLLSLIEKFEKSQEEQKEDIKIDNNRIDLRNKIREYMEIGNEIGLFENVNLKDVYSKIKDVEIIEDNTLTGDAEVVIVNGKNVIKINTKRCMNQGKHFLDEVIFHELTHFTNEIHQDLYGDRPHKIMLFKKRYSDFSKHNQLLKYPEWGAILLDEAIAQKVAQVMCEKKYGRGIYQRRGIHSKIIDDKFLLYSDFAKYPEYERLANNFSKTIVGREGLMGLAKLSMRREAVDTILSKYLKEKDGTRKLYEALGYMGNIAIADYASKGHFVLQNSEENRRKQSVLESMQKANWIMEDVIEQSGPSFDD